MSDYIPFHILEQILERLPVKSLIKFTSVSKSWRSFIVSTDFITAHSGRCHTQPEHLLVQYKDQRQVMKTCALLVDDDETFPQQRFVQTLPSSVKFSLFPIIIGSSHGLLCARVGDSKAVIWNPSIRKSIPIRLPYVPTEQVFFSFGVCPITLDPKILNMRRCSRWCSMEKKFINHWEAMVYTLSLGEWSQIPDNNLPSKECMFTGPQVNIDRFIYWLAYYPRTIHLIMSFDITNECFEAIHLPHSLACTGYNKLSISKLRDSLVIFESSINTENQIVSLVAWKMMKHDDVERSLAKLYRIEAQHESVMKVVGIRRSGQPIMEVKHTDEFKSSKLVVYDPNLHHFRNLKINRASNDFLVHSYEETLFLLGRSDCSSY